MSLWAVFVMNLKTRWVEFQTRGDLLAQQLRRVCR